MREKISKRPLSFKSCEALFHLRNINWARLPISRPSDILSKKERKKIIVLTLSFSLSLSLSLSLSDCLSVCLSFSLLSLSPQLKRNLLAIVYTWQPYIFFKTLNLASPHFQLAPLTYQTNNTIASPFSTITLITPPA